MNKTRITRQEVNEGHILALQAEVNSIVVEFKKTHGFFSFAGDRKKELDKLNAKIKGIVESKEGTSFDRYNKILAAVNGCKLDQKKDLGTIKQFQSILSNHLATLKGTGWRKTHQEKIQIRINSSLDKLTREEINKEEKHFYRKWQVAGSRLDEYPLWKHLVDNINPYLGLRVEDNNIVILPGKVNARPGALTGEVKKLAGIKVKNNNSLNLENPNYGPAAENRDEQDGMLESILKQAEEEFDDFEIKDTNHPRHTFTDVFIKTITSLSSYTSIDESYIKLTNKLSDRFDAFPEEQEKLRNIQEMINEKKNNKNQIGVNESAAIIHKMKEITAKWLPAIELQNLRNKLKNSSKGISDIKDIVNFIINEDKIFSNDLREKVEQLKKQINIMSLNNLFVLGVNHLQHYADVTMNRDKANSVSDTQRESVETLLTQLIHEVINPLRQIFGMSEFAQADIKSLKDDLRQKAVGIDKWQNKMRTLKFKNCGFFFHKTLEEAKEKTKTAVDDLRGKNLQEENMSEIERNKLIRKEEKNISRQEIGTEKTRYAVFKSQIIQWVLDAKNEILSSEECPSMEQFNRIKAEYMKIQSEEKEKLNLFFQKEFGEQFDIKPSPAHKLR